MKAGQSRVLECDGCHLGIVVVEDEYVFATRAGVRVVQMIGHVV